MREGCSCNAWVRGTTRQVLRWRTEHRCPDRPEPEGADHINTGALIENSARREYDGMEARIGFQMETS